MKENKCELGSECKKEVTHIDQRGIIFCNDHYLVRKKTDSCRKLSGHEKKELKAGKALSRFKQE